MKLLMENWRKHLKEIEEGEESKEINADAKEWIGLTISGHFSDYSARIRSLNPQDDPENQKRLAPMFAKDLRAVDDEEKRNPFYKAVYLDNKVPEEEQDRVVGLLKKLADAIEADPTLLDAREIGYNIKTKEGDWTAVAERGAGAPTAEQRYEKYWQQADPYAEDDDDLAPGKADEGSQEALQYSRAISSLKRLEENPSEEEIKQAILDGWDEGSHEYMDDYDQDDARGGDDY